MTKCSKCGKEMKVGVGVYVPMISGLSGVGMKEVVYCLSCFKNL